MIDRQALVSRHNIVMQKADALSPLSLGNGRFVFSADITGLQSLAEFYDSGMPLNTMAEWGWHLHPNVEKAAFENSLVDVDTYGRSVSYPLKVTSMSEDWLRANPHQSNLAQIGFVLERNSPNRIKVEDVKEIAQELDLWHGVLESTFSLSGDRVEVETLCHPELDVVAVRVRSSLMANGKLGIAVRFPYPSGTWGRSPSSWEHDEKHVTLLRKEEAGVFVLERKVDDLGYTCKVSCDEPIICQQDGEHSFSLWADGPACETFSFTFSFSEFAGDAIDFETVVQETRLHWPKFWNQGAAIDLSKSKDSRWTELERRIVLSQYLTAIQSCGTLPPAETGLTCTSWFGKFHLEMHWWHVVHFALWGRLDHLESSLSYYNRILFRAQETARRQGYAGARWPKMVGPEGQESPSGVGPMLIWQQPHPIYYAELCYRQHKDQETLELYQEIVFETADFMVSYAHWNEDKQQYDLGPPLIPAQENHKYGVTVNPVYELEYWHWALRVAQEWRIRLGLSPNPEWEKVINLLAPLPTKDGLYLATENKQDSWEDSDLWRDHPSFLAALGVLPGALVDRDIMSATLLKTREVWDWERAWGWDFPVVAMCAARLGLQEMAIDFLLLDVTKNRYLPNGHNYQAERLPLYLPGNGGLLTTVAMMAAGWDGSKEKNCPGFPDNGQWDVLWEGFMPMP